MQMETIFFSCQIKHQMSHLGKESEIIQQWNGIQISFRCQNFIALNEWRMTF